MKELSPIRETPKDYEDIEKEIVELFKKELYLPLIRLLKAPEIVLKNSMRDLVDAIVSGRLRYDRGVFSGRLSATLSRELRRIGAKWDRKRDGFSIPQSKLPFDVRIALSMSEDRLKQSVAKIDKQLSAVSPEEIAGKLDVGSLLDSALYRVEQKFQKTVQGITVAPQITPEMRERISSEYVKNLQLYVQDFVQKEIEELRNRVSERASQGLRYEGLVQEIQRSYGVSQNKAKFLARQETSLMMTKYKQTRYEDAGVKLYKWKTVIGSPQHPVRPRHKHLDGKIFSWDSPPIVDDKGNRKNPGQDYNCRCVAIPVVRF
jgi:SPP1 gp7 family putative phage head morphogenesis protein